MRVYVFGLEFPSLEGKPTRFSNMKGLPRLPWRNKLAKIGMSSVAGSRRVTGLEFRFKPDPQGKLDIEDADDEQLSPLETAAPNALDNSDNDK